MDLSGVPETVDAQLPDAAGEPELAAAPAEPRARLLDPRIIEVRP